MRVGWGSGGHPPKNKQTNNKPYFLNVMDHDNGKQKEESFSGIISSENKLRMLPSCVMYKLTFINH